MSKTSLCWIPAVLLGLAGQVAGQPLEAGFADPPVLARPGAFWCWLNGSISHEQITSDLEEMKAKGMGGAEIWDVAAHRNPGGFVPAGPAFMGEESVGAIVHAIREGTRLGLRLGMVASSGWNAGGSWVPPEHAGKGLFWSQTGVEGPATVETTLVFPACDKAPKGADGLPQHYKEIAVLAVPAAKTLGSIESVVDLSRFMDAGGKLTWDAPAGKWTIMRVICTNHGQRLIVPSPNSNGPMIDFIDPAATGFHLKYMMGKILAKLGREDFRGTAFSYMEFDSMELAEGVLWSDHFAERFAELRGYSPIPYLPLLTGWKLEDGELNARFLSDFKLAISDQLIFSHYVTGKKVLNEYGLNLVAEAGGPGPPVWDSCPVDAIKALGAVDVPRGEFWMGNPKNLFLIKEIASAAHVYGKPLVDAEAFTTWRRWIDGPVTHKQLADRALCEGLNHFTFHTFASTPPEAGLPGRAYHAGTDINTTATWWPKAKPFMDYLARCSHMLRQGRFVADVCYYYGDQAPNFYPAHHNVPRKIVRPELGLGYDYDVCDAETILTRMEVRDGRIVLPDGMSYAMLALPEQDAMPVEVLRKIEELVASGATVAGRKPLRTRGLQGSQANDAGLKELTDRLWGSGDGGNIVIAGPSWREVLASKGIGPDFHVIDEAARDDFDFIHRSTENEEIYFVRNRTLSWKEHDCVFRVKAGHVRFWDPVSGSIEPAEAFEAVTGGTQVKVKLPPAGSVFVVFGKDGRPNGTKAADATVDAAADAGGARLPVLALDGPWTLRFPEGWGAPDSVVMEPLKSWTDSDVPGVKYFSGTATYEKTVSVSEAMARNAGSLWLDLGDVKEVAEVFLNGQSLGIVWTPPYRVKMAAALKPGENQLMVEVTNLWSNRMIGDKAVPSGGTYTRSNLSDRFSADDLPMPSGLLGPVRVVCE